MLRRVAPLFVVACAGCCAVKPSPFEPVHAEREEDVLSVLARRAPPPESLYAVLSMYYDGPDQRGSFDVVMRYRRPGDFRFTAFKDLVVAAHDIFDLVLRGDRYEVAYERDDAPLRVYSGPLERLASDHPRFSGFAWAREALFLPGAVTADPPPRVRFEDDAVIVSSRLSSGVPVRWHLDPETLAVRWARLCPPSAAPVRLVYSDYERRAGRIMATRVRLEDPAHSLYVSGRLEELELDPVLEDSEFELEPR